MTLYQSTGEAFELTAREWLNLLAHASRYGWAPGDPQAAAIDFDLDRPYSRVAALPRFESPSGQVMSASDVHRLAAAIRKGEPHTGMDGDWLGRFCGFCESGNSLLLSEYPPPPSALTTSPSPTPIGRQLINLSNSLGLSARPIPQPLPTELPSTQELEPALTQKR